MPDYVFTPPPVPSVDISGSEGYVRAGSGELAFQVGVGKLKAKRRGAAQLLAALVFSEGIPLSDG